MILVDTSGLLALLDAGEARHEAAHAAIATERGPRVVTDLVLAETDFLVLKRLGPAAERAFLSQVLDGTFLREAISPADLQRATEIIEQFAEHRIGLCDATLMAIAERRRCLRVLTLDRRHFTVFRTVTGDALEFLP